MTTFRRSLPILAVLALAFALRMVTIESRPLWYDDAFSVLLAERGPAQIAAGTAADTMPPGYYLLLWGWMAFAGQTPLAMRMLSVTLSLLVVALTYAVGRRSFGARAGWWAALLVAVLPFQIYHAQELRMYTLLAVGCCLFIYGVLGLGIGAPGRDDDARDGFFEGQRRRAVALVAIGTATALYAHNLAFVTLLAGNVALALQALRGKITWRRQGELIAGELAGGILFLPWLVYVPTQLDKIQRAFWTQPPGLLDAVQALMLFTTYLPLPPLLLVACLFLSILILFLVAWRVARLARGGGLPALVPVVTFALFPPLALFALSYGIRPVFVPRGLIGSAIAYMLLLALVLARMPRAAQLGAAGVVLVLAGALLPFYYAAYGEWRRAPFDASDAFLRSRRQAGDVILHDNKLSFLPMHLYDRTLPQAFLADPPGSDNDTFAPASQAAMRLEPTEWQSAAAARRVWFVIYRTALEEAAADGKPHPNLARLEATMQRTDETEYGDLDILLYTRR